MLSLEDSGEDESPMKRMKLDDVERERILRLEGELVSAKTQERLSKTITDFYEENRSLREEIKRLQDVIEELKAEYGA
jgi:predicted RNase H-like nuclease (RuvC/YqgF family)